MVERLTTFGVHNAAVRDITNTQAEMLKFQEQITSGRKASSFTELGADIGAVLDLESSLKSSDRFISANKTVLSRLRTMDVAISQLEDIAADLAQQLVLESGTSGATLNITEFANSALDRVADGLNTQINGRFLFGGSKTNIPPIADGSLINNTNIVNNQVSGNYYQGDSLKFSVQSSQQSNTEYGIVGDDIAFQNLIGALNLAKRSENGAQGSANVDLQSAISAVNAAVEDLARVRNQINTDILTLETSNSQHERVKLNLQDIFNETVAADVVEASIQIQFNEAILTATMQTFARLSQLSLTEFLR